eukprot:TRINITY_DN6605_c0_g1_i2.p1 TRINITY_DN6605_c0_g1~~TRINITY_DN6605_c0_g1_i2.p1  ORF type:complete len:323 (+),score=55.58 TRINITY_DN6605_c0_g1_i2:62-1030(+)
MKYGYTPKLMSLDSVEDDDFIICIAWMGAPSVILERLWNKNDIIEAINITEKEAGKEASSIFCAEVGGLNSMEPLCASMALGLPLIDGDGMSRAFPNLSHIDHLFPDGVRYPFVFYNTANNTHSVHYGDSISVIEPKVIGALIKSGFIGVICFGLDGDQVKKSFRNTISLSWKIGKALSTAKENDQTYEQAIQSFTNAKCVFSGMVTEIHSKTGIHDHGYFIILDKSTQQEMKILYLNESIQAEIDGNIICVVPDIIGIIDRDTGEPFQNADIQYGFNVSVICIPVSPKLVAKPEKYGTQFFNLETEYKPIGDYKEPQSILD